MEIKRVLWIVIGLLLTMQLSMAYQSYSINENWQFALEGSKWESINLPHTWNLHDAHSDEPYYRGTGVYIKKLTIESEQLDKSVFIQFDGVNAFADVFINDRFVGQHKGGYTAFRFEITKFLRAGSNQVKVIANNELHPDYPPLDGDFTMFGGIYRDVQLIVAHPFHIDLGNLASSGVFIRQSIASEKQVDISINTSLSNKKRSDVSGVLMVKILDDTNREVAKSSKRVKLKSLSELDVKMNLPTIQNPQLWSPDNPYLYTALISLSDSQGEELDSRIEPLGIRWFSVDQQKGFYLNGQHLKLIGVNRHQDFSGYGNAVPDEVHLKDMQLIKEMGCNFLRIAHYPQDKMILEECDRLGILSCVEVPLNNQNNVFSQSYWDNTMLRQREMVRQSFNHPSVVIWAMLNECLLRTKLRRPYDSDDPYLKKTGEFAAAINSLLKKEDPDRLTMIVNSEKPDIHLAAGTGLTPDIIGWNLYHCWYGEEKFNGELNDFISDMHQKFPGKGLMITEYGGGADPRISCEDPHRWDFSREYQVKIHKHFMETILDRDDVIGGAVWNFADFASGVRQDTDPNINSKGLMTNNRVPKDSYYYYKVMLSSEPIVRIASKDYNRRIGHQNTQDSELCTQRIEVFGKGGDITLFHNGKRLGTKQADRHHSVVFEVPFINGANQLEAKCGDSSDRVDIDFNIVPDNPNIFTGKVNISLGDHRQFVSREPAGEVFVPEKEFAPKSWGYMGGEAVIKEGLPSVGTALNIYRTQDDPVYQSHRVGIEGFNFAVSPGYYEISLLFMEPNLKFKAQSLIYELSQARNEDDGLDKRVFHVVVNDEIVLKNFNILEEAGARSAIKKKISIKVKDDDGIKICFTPVEGKTILSGISLRKIR